MPQREQRRHLRFLQRETVWLQKVSFGLGKAEAARAKSIEAIEEEETPFTIEIAGDDVKIEDLRTAIDRKIEEIRDRMREIERDL